MESIGWLTATIRSALAEALALVLPVECAGCDEPDVALCERCIAQLAPHVTLSRSEVWSGLRFEGVPARVVRALKEDGRTRLARDLAPALKAAVDAAQAAPSRAEGGADETRAATAPVVVVPIPTSRAAYRRRGYRVVELVARARRIALRAAARPRPGHRRSAGSRSRSTPSECGGLAGRARAPRASECWSSTTS